MTGDALREVFLPPELDTELRKIAGSPDNTPPRGSLRDFVYNGAVRYGIPEQSATLYQCKTALNMLLGSADAVQVTADAAGKLTVDVDTLSGGVGEERTRMRMLGMLEAYGIVPDDAASSLGFADLPTLAKAINKVVAWKTETGPGAALLRERISNIPAEPAPDIAR